MAEDHGKAGRGAAGVCSEQWAVREGLRWTAEGRALSPRPLKCRPLRQVPDPFLPVCVALLLPLYHPSLHPLLPLNYSQVQGHTGSSRANHTAPQAPTPCSASPPVPTGSRPPPHPLLNKVSFPKCPPSRRLSPQGQRPRPRAHCRPHSTQALSTAGCWPLLPWSQRPHSIGRPFLLLSQPGSLGLCCSHLLG